MATEGVERVVLIGSGPAGYTAAIYAARGGLRPVLFEGFQTGGIPGGQLMTTTEVENYPGFPEGISGPAMMEAFRKQAIRFGTRFHTEDVVRVDFSRRPFRVASAEREVLAESAILATGAGAKYLGLPSEKRLMNQGVSACAVCDGALPIFRNQVLAVVGGGDSAMEESLYLTKFAQKVQVIHRRDSLRASKIMVDRAAANPKIAFVWNSVVEEVLGKDRVEGVRLKNVKSGESSTLPCGGLFLAIGHQPNTEVFRDRVELDPAGYIVTKERTLTSVPGVFAAGDCVDHRYRQAVTAAGMGCMAALDCEKWLEGQG